MTYYNGYFYIAYMDYWVYKVTTDGVFVETVLTMHSGSGNPTVSAIASMGNGDFIINYGGDSTKITYAIAKLTSNGALTVQRSFSVPISRPAYTVSQDIFYKDGFLYIPLHHSKTDSNSGITGGKNSIYAVNALIRKHKI